MSAVPHASGHASSTLGPSPVDDVARLLVSGLTVLDRRSGAPIVSDFSIVVGPGETLGIVGESGCGKTTSALAMLGLHDEAQLDTQGTSLLGGTEMVTASESARRERWGKDVGVIYQDALRALNPVQTVGKQIEEVFEVHGGHPDVDAEIVRLLRRVGIASPEKRRHQYPHELSGGMRQRVMIAIAVAMRPRLLVADEPTTALDVTIQAQVLELIKDLAHESGTSTVLISHDLGVIAGMCDRVVVMYAGRIVEQGPTTEVFANPRHHYTQALLSATPGHGVEKFASLPGQPPAPDALAIGCGFAERCTGRQEICADTTPMLQPVSAEHSVACFNHVPGNRGTVAERAHVLERVATRGTSVQPRSANELAPVVLEALGVHKDYGKRRFLQRSFRPVKAVDGVDLALRAGECLGLVGESGSGKSSLGRLLVGMEPPTAGELHFEGRPVHSVKAAELRAFRRRAQMIYQEPRSSLNRSFTIRKTLHIALRAGGHTSDLDRRASEMLDRVGLARRHLDRYPSALSGGECQRVAIARALCVEPTVLVADEAVSSLDVSVQGQILTLLADIQAESQIGIVFIAHDLAVVRELCHNVAVMYLGRIVEYGPARDVLGTPQHPYSMSLKSAAPVPDPAVERDRRRILLLGDPPSPASPPSGCSFHTRCPVGPTADPGRSECVAARPDLVGDPGHRAACHFLGSTANQALLKDVT